MTRRWIADRLRTGIPVTFLSRCQRKAIVNFDNCTAFTVSVSFLILFLAAMILPVLGCKQKSIQKEVKIADVTQSNTVVLKSTSRGMVSGITLDISGYLDGTASIAIGSTTPAVLGPGEIKRVLYEDWFYPTCAVQYAPAGVRTGHLQFFYELR